MQTTIVYTGAIPKTPGKGTVLISVAPKVEKKNGLYLDTRYDSSISDGMDNWKHECAYILKEIRETNDRTRRNKMNERELLDYAHKHYPPKPNPTPALGVDRYNSVYGTVLAIPKGMPVDRVTKKPIKCEVKVGDTVYYHYLALSNSSMWHDKGALADDWATITYSSIFFCKRNSAATPEEVGEIIMLNNFVLIEPIEDAPLSKILEMPKKVSTKKGKVAYVPEGSELKVGQICYWMKNSNVRLEYEFIKTLDKEYLRIKEEQIIGVEDNG